MRATGQLQHRVVDKQAHDRVQVMGVEGVEQALEGLDGCRARAGHHDRLLWCLIVSLWPAAPASQRG
jgi:hypothetical protein